MKATPLPLRTGSQTRRTAGPGFSPTSAIATARLALAFGPLTFVDRLSETELADAELPDTGPQDRGLRRAA